MRLPVSERWKIVHACQRLGSVSATARELGRDASVVKRWVERHQATGDVLDLHRNGRPRAMSPETRAASLDMLMSKEHGGAAAVARALKDAGMVKQVLHKATIIRNAVAEAKGQGFCIRAVKGKPVKMLTEATMEARRTFSTKHATRLWRSVMFTDRKKFHHRYPGAPMQRVSWLRYGERREVHMVNHPSSLNVYAGITPFGMTSLHVVAGTTNHKNTYLNKQGGAARNITSQEYRDVLTQTLLPEGRRLFMKGGITTWTLQQDNDPTHSCAWDVVKSYNSSKGSSVSVLDGWPPNSPDLSLIETMWAFLDARMDSLGCKTFPEFKAALIRECAAISQKHCMNLYASMPKRLQSCLALEGKRTKY